jgi:hypothetical protein
VVTLRKIRRSRSQKYADALIRTVINLSQVLSDNFLIALFCLSGSFEFEGYSHVVNLKNGIWPITNILLIIIFRDPFSTMVAEFDSASLNV